MEKDRIILQQNNIADLKFLIENIDGCKHNSKNSSTTKLKKDNPSGFP